MGEVEIDIASKTIRVHSHIIIYGDAVSGELAALMQEEIETLWNEPKAHLYLKDHHFLVEFRISASVYSAISDLDVISNTDPRKNFFRIENFIHGNISFVDGLGCNSGYFLTENLYRGSTTAAHEYGHTLGLPHPKHLDIRGEGIPGIMYPRGTLVDPPYQYDPTKPAGVTGGTMHPMHRKVRKQDIDDLKLERILNHPGIKIVGNFTNIYHNKHIPGSVER